MRSSAPKGSKARGGAQKPTKAGTLVTKAVEAAAKPPKPRKPPAPPVTRNNNLPEVTIKVQRKAGYKQGPFDRKMRALQRLSDDGKLFKQANPVARNDAITKAYKQRVREAIWKKYWPHDKETSRKLTDKLDTLDPDHVWELQLGGADDASNLRLLDADTNRDIGNQIWQQIRTLPDGTPIRIEVVD